MSRSILIFGATGKQGGSLIDALLAENADFEILAVTRTASSASAQKLTKKSPKIKVVEGTLDDTASLFAKAKEVSSSPIWGVFSVQLAGGSEEKQGKSLADEAIKAGVKFFVYSSVDRGGDEISYDTPTNIPHFISKYNIEHHIVSNSKNTDMKYAFLRPVAFFDNLAPDTFGKVFTTSYRKALKDKPLQLIATKDIGHFAAQAFLHPEAYEGKGLSLAGDSLTYAQFQKIFKEKTGQDVAETYGFLSSALMWAIKDFGYMFQWFHDVGYGADIQALKKQHPGLKDFATWLEKDSAFETK